MQFFLPLASPLCVIAACSSPDSSPTADGVDAGAPDGQPEPPASDPEPPRPDPDDDPGELPWHDAAASIGNNGGGFRPAEIAYGAGPVRVQLDVMAPATNEPVKVNAVAYAVYRPGRYDVFFKVRNVGTAVRCFAELRDIAFRDGAGTPLPEDGGGSVFVLGSVRRVGSVTTDTCLAPQEAAWTAYASELTWTQLVAARQVAVTVDSLPAGGDLVEPTARVMPTRMQLTQRDIRVELENQGTGPAKLQSSAWIAFDRMGLPLGRGYLLHPTSQLAHGASVVTSQFPAKPLDVDPFSPLAGTVAAVLVRVDYDDAL